MLSCWVNLLQITNIYIYTYIYIYIYIWVNVRLAGKLDLNNLYIKVNVRLPGKLDFNNLCIRGNVRVWGFVYGVLFRLRGRLTIRLLKLIRRLYELIRCL